LIKEQLHLAKVSVDDFLEPVIIQLIWLNGVDLSLAIDTVYLISLSAVETLVGEVFAVGLHLPRHRLVWKLDPMFINLRDSNHSS